MQEGVRHGMAVLNDDLVRKIRTEAAQGKNYCAIARELGVDPSTIRDAATGRTWRHVA
jgi:transposase-like protein